MLTELKNRSDLLIDPENLKECNKEIDVFERVRNDKDFQEELRFIQKRQYEAQSRFAWNKA